MLLNLVKTQHNTIASVG